MKKSLSTVAASAAVILTLSSISAAATHVWQGQSVADTYAYHGNSVTVNGSGNLVVGVGTLKGWNDVLNGVSGHVYQGRASIAVAPEINVVEATFKMPASTPVGPSSISGKNAYNSWLSVRSLYYPSGVEHSGDAGFYFTSRGSDLGDMYYSNTRVVGDPATNDNPEFGQDRAGAFAPGTTHRLKIERLETGQLEYSLDGNVFSTSPMTSALFSELNTIELGGGFFVPGATGSVNDLPTGGFEFTGFTAVPEPTTLAVLGLGGLALLRRRRA